MKIFYVRNDTNDYARLDPFNGWQKWNKLYATPLPHRSYAEKVIDFLSKVDSMCYDHWEIVEEEEPVEKEYEYAIKVVLWWGKELKDDYIYMQNIDDDFMRVSKNERTLYFSKEAAKKDRTAMIKRMKPYIGFLFKIVKVPVK